MDGVDPEVLDEPEDDPRDHVLRDAHELGRRVGRTLGTLRAMMLGAKPAKRNCSVTLG